MGGYRRLGPPPPAGFDKVAAQIGQLLIARDVARSARDYAAADAHREQLKELGVDGVDDIERTWRLKALSDAPTDGPADGELAGGEGGEGDGFARRGRREWLLRKSARQGQGPGGGGGGVGQGGGAGGGGHDPNDPRGPPVARGPRGLWLYADQLRFNRLPPPAPAASKLAEFGEMMLGVVGGRAFAFAIAVFRGHSVP